ncbi:LPXTG cell wall anchor domain-containing protein [Solwaraspora sp. WMMB335]
MTTGGSGGDLPVTGANAALVGAVGGGVVAIGAALLFFARRRRMVVVSE